jgi:hypothetical protein
MHTRHHGIRRHDQLAARRRHEHGGIILEIECTRPRERPEMATDQAELGGQRGREVARRPVHA